MPALLQRIPSFHRPSLLHQTLRLIRPWPCGMMRPLPRAVLGLLRRLPRRCLHVGSSDPRSVLLESLPSLRLRSQRVPLLNLRLRVPGDALVANALRAGAPQVVAKCQTLAATDEGAQEWLQNVADSEIPRVDLQSCVKPPPFLSPSNVPGSLF